MKTNTKRSLVALVTALSLALPTFAAGEPGNVSNVTVTPKDATTLTVKWNEMKDSDGSPVDHYKIYYGPESVQGTPPEAARYTSEVETPTSATTFDLTGLTADTTYYLSVTALDKDGDESVEYSIEASGTPSDKPAQTADQIAPTVLNVIAADKNHVLVRFSEKIVLPETLPETAFVINEQANPEKMLEVNSAKMYADDVEGKTVVLETVNQTANINYIVTASVAVKDTAGNTIQSGNTDSGVFVGSNLVSSNALKPSATENTTTPEDLLEDSTTPTSNGTTNNNTNNNTNNTNSTTNNQNNTTPTTPAADTKAPEDVRNLALSFKEQVQKFVVAMKWDASLNTAKDLVDQIVYMSTDMGKTFDAGRSVGAINTNYEMANLEGGKEYTFKVTTKDSNGNESVGVVKSIRLPSTGFGAGMLVLGSAYGAHKFLKRRRQKLEQNAQ